MILAVALLALSSMSLNGCSRSREEVRTIVIAQCEAGAWLVEERVVERRGFTGKTTVAKHSLKFQAADGRRVPIDVSSRGSYRSAAEDRLSVLREPSEGDWQVYVDPALIDPKGYGEWVKCLQSNSAEGSSTRSTPTIASIRYANLHQLRKRYECANGERLELREDGFLYFQSDSSVLLGVVLTNDTFVLDASALHYLASRASRAIADPLPYIQRCRHSSGKTLIEEFKSAVMPQAVFWQKLQDQRDERRHVYRSLLHLRDQGG
jgi:hypothetical protein